MEFISKIIYLFPLNTIKSCSDACFPFQDQKGLFSFYIKDWYLDKALSESKINIIKYMAQSFFWMSTEVCNVVTCDFDGQAGNLGFVD